VIAAAAWNRFGFPALPATGGASREEGFTRRAFDF
jgi:hypothetical protein